jgi:uncharacterized membrane protein
MNRPLFVVPAVLVVALLGAVGQTLLKLALGRLPAGGGLGAALLALATSAAFWAGGLLVAAGGATWLFVLSRAQITYAMPFLSMGFVLTMITSALILHEPQPLLRVVGTLVVTGGMVLVGLAR